MQAIAVSPTGQVAGVAQKRPRRHPPTGPAYAGETAYSEIPRARRNSPEKSRLRSSADDSLDASFLVSSMKDHHGRTASSKSVKSFGSTPPSDTAPKVMFLTGSMVTHVASSKPDQVGFRGTLPGAVNPQIVAYLAQKYKAIPLPDPPDVASFMHLERVFNQNADCAQRASLHRLAQSWRVVGASISVATRRRAELHCEQRRLRKSAPRPPVTPLDPPGAVANPSIVPPNPAVRAILGTLDKPRSSPLPPAQATAESTSNLPTPLARPQADSHTNTKVDGSSQPTPLPDLDQEPIDQLPPAVTGPPSHPQSSSEQSRTTAHARLHVPPWQHAADRLEERRALIGSYRASPRVPFSFAPHPVSDAHGDLLPPLERQDSSESFTMFSASSDSQKGNSVPSSCSFASVNSHSRSVRSSPDSRQGEQARSSFGRPRPSTSTWDQPFGSSQSRPTSPTTMPVDTEVPSDRYRDPGSQHTLDGAGSRHWFAFGSSERVVEDMEHLRRNNQLLRHDSSESEAYASASASSLIDQSADMEASGTIIAEVEEPLDPGLSVAALDVGGRASTPSPPPPPPPLLSAAANDHGVTLSDFQAMHVDAEEGSAFSVIGLLGHLLAYHANAADAQFSAFLLLLLAPLLPQTHGPIHTPGLDVAEVLGAFTETFVSLGLTPTQAKAILATQLGQLIATGINPYQAESILHTYHAQLHSLSLYNSAAELRRLTYPTYPAVYEQALKDTQIGLLCLSCKSPINNPKNKTRCESCRRTQAPCPVCWSKYPAFESSTWKKRPKPKPRSSISDPSGPRGVQASVASMPASETEGHTDSPALPSGWSPPAAMLWTWCPLCGHGGHTNCLSTWFAESSLSDGACPTEGCLCDCVTGQCRETKLEEVARKKADRDKAKVVRKGDDWKVNESRAVTAVRSATLDAIPDQQQQQQQGDFGAGARKRRG